VAKWHGQVKFAAQMGYRLHKNAAGCIVSEIPARKLFWTPFIVTLTIAIPEPEETASSVNPSTLHSRSVLPWTNWCMPNSATKQRRT
jgi:hypothetical protein